MTSTASGTWTLQGITDGRGACDHCGRSLARLFRVTNPEGQQMVVWRVCSARFTGWNLSVAQAERAERFARLEAAAQAKWGDLYVQAREAAAAVAARTGTAGGPGEALTMMRDQPHWVDDDEARAFVARCLA